jgi:hypothetical protein
MNDNELCTKLIGINSELKVILMSAYENIEFKDRLDEKSFTIS